jgi:hypothetical protein
VTGSIEGENVVATFIEDGSLQSTNGRFIWKLQNENAALARSLQQQQIAVENQQQQESSSVVLIWLFTASLATRS